MSAALPTAAAARTRPLAIVHTESSTGWGGQEIRILTEAAGLRDRGHDVSLLAALGARIVEEAPRFGVPVTALPIGRKRPAGLAAMTRALSMRRFDIVNTQKYLIPMMETGSTRVALLARDPAVAHRQIGPGDSHFR